MAFSAIGHRPSKHKPPADDRYFSGEARGQENPKVNDWPIFKCTLAVLLAILLALLVAIRQQNTPRPQAITLHDLLARQTVIQNPLAFPTHQGDISKVIVHSTGYSDAGTNSNDVPSFNPKGQLPVEQTQLGKVIWSTKLENNAIFEVRISPGFDIQTYRPVSSIVLRDYTCAHRTFFLDAYQLASLVQLIRAEQGSECRVVVHKFSAQSAFTAGDIQHAAQASLCCQ